MVNWLRRIRIRRLERMICGLTAARDEMYYWRAQGLVVSLDAIVGTTRLLAEFEEKLRQLKEDT